MNLKNIKMLILLSFSLFYITGCAAPQAEISKVRFFWPPLPDEPKIEWIGTYNSHLELSDRKSYMTFLTGEEDAHGLDLPFSAASNGQGKVYITDIGNLNVLVFDFIKKETHIMGGIVTASLIEKPSGIDLDEEGNIFVGDLDKKKIIVFTKNEIPARVLDFSTTMKNVGVFKLDRQRKRIIIPDIKGHQVIISDYQGKILSTIRVFKSTNGEDGFRFPTSVAIDPNGNILVADSINARIVRFTPEGEFLSIIGTRGDTIGTMDFVKGIATDSDGHIYTVDQRSDRLQIFNDKGQIMMAIGDKNLSNVIGAFHSPNSIYIDKNDTIYITETPAKRFQVMQYLSKDYLSKNPIVNSKEAAKPLSPAAATVK